MDLTNPVSAEEIRATAQAMAQAVEQEAQDVGVAAEDRAAQLAPGLATGSNAPGGYNYARFVAPVVDPLVTNFVLQGQQNVLRDTLREAQYAADQELSAAESAYKGRQRAYQAEQARRTRQRMAEAERRRKEAERQARADRLAQQRLAAMRANNNRPIASNPNPSPAAVVSRPTTPLRISVAQPTRQPLRVVNGGGLQGYGGIGNNAVLRVR